MQHRSDHAPGQQHLVHVPQETLELVIVDPLAAGEVRVAVLASLRDPATVAPHQIRAEQDAKPPVTVLELADGAYAQVDAADLLR